MSNLLQREFTTSVTAMSTESAPAAESGAIQGFIVARQAGILERAITTLRECPDEDLIAETHRLSGTLGTYQLTDAATAVRAVHDALRSGQAIPSDTDRGDTISVLVRSLDEVRAASGGDLRA